MRLPACSQLPQLADRGFSLLSLNVLLPNSVDGWWIYKMYGPGVPRAATAWDARSVLLRDLVLEADADVVAFQETSAESFTTDFGWMIDAGYDFELHAKGRMRPATFWKRARLAPCTADGNPVGSSGSPAIHGDRTLTTPLVLLGEGGEPCGQPPLFVINCHLSAGQEARRRLRQVHEALEAVRKAREKLAPKGKGGKGGKGVKSPADESAAEASVVVCGDFNSQGRSGVRQLLCEGEVRPDFRESGDPTEKDKEEYEVTSKVKVQRLGRFADAAELACAEGGEAVAPTLIAPELQSKMEAEGGGASPALLEAVGDMFRAMSADGVGMSGEEQTRWLTTINGKVGRGDEYRSAEAAKLERGSDVLSEDDLVRVYTEGAPLPAPPPRRGADTSHRPPSLARRRAAQRQVLGHRARREGGAGPRPLAPRRAPLHRALRLRLLHGGLSRAGRHATRPARGAHGIAARRQLPDPERVVPLRPSARRRRIRVCAGHHGHGGVGVRGRRGRRLEPGTRRVSWTRSPPRQP